MARAGRLHTVAALLGLTVCVAVAPAASASARAGWSAPVHADRGLHARFVRGLSCPSAKFCAAVDEAGRVVFYRGGGWTKPASVDTALKGDDVLLGISCTFKAFCVTFNAQGDVFVYDGHHWRRPSSLWSAGIYESGQVSCPTSHFCVLENGHRVYVYRDGRWSAGPNVKATGVSCSSGRFCVVTSRSGTASFASVYRKKLAKRRPLDRGSDVATVSCASDLFCVAGGARLLSGRADGGGTAVTYRGHSWSKPTPLASAPTGPTSVSCASNRFCAALDGAGNALIYNGRVWSAAVPADSHARGKPVWVSCPASSFCMAIDSFGYAVRRRAG